MSTNYVDTEAIDSQAEELKATVGAICSSAEEIASQCNSICGYASEYVQYNGYFDSDTKDTQYEEVPAGNNKTTKKPYEVCQKFVLTDGNITSKAQRLQQKANELSAVMVVLKQDSVLLKQVAAAIASNINSTNVALTSAYSRANGGGSLYIADEKFNTLAYGALAMNGVQKANLARSAEDIKNRNFLNYSDVKDNGLSGKMLQFRAQPDGTYKIYTIDGEDTGYYTTFTAANNYQRTLKRELLKGDKNYVEKTYSNNGSVDTKRLSEDTAKVATGVAAIAGISATSQNTSQIRGAAAMAGAPTTGNRNIGTKNTDNTKTLPDGSIQKTIAKSGKSEVRLITDSHNSQICLNDSGKSITPSNDAIESIKSMEHSISKNEGINLSKSSSVEMINQDGSITKYYYNSNDKNQLVRVISTDKNGIQQSFLDNKDYAEKFSQISNLKEGNTRRYLDSNGNCFYETFISENGTDAFG